jgi:hypothetical protein
MSDADAGGDAKRSSQDLRAMASRSVLWTAIGKASNTLISLGVTAVLTRILTPADFGIVAMVVVISGFLNILAEAGVSTAVVQKRDLSARALSSFFWLGLGIASLTGVDARYVWNRAVAGVLHRDPPDTSQQLREPGIELVASGIDGLVSRQSIEGSPLDGVHKASRLADGGHQIKPAAGRHFRPVRGSQQARCNGIRAVKIVEQPPVQPLGFERPLYGRNVQRHENSV